MKRLWSKTEIEGVAKESSKQLYQHNIIVTGTWGTGEAFTLRMTIIDDQSVGYTTMARLATKITELGAIEASGGTTNSKVVYPILAVKSATKTAVTLTYFYTTGATDAMGFVSSLVDVVKAI